MAASWSSFEPAADATEAPAAVSNGPDRIQWEWETGLKTQLEAELETGWQ
jgi:hypothetical protein